MKKKHITTEPSEVPQDSPYIDKEYCGDLDFLKKQVMDKFDSWKQARTLWDPYWFLNRAWYSGRHYMQWNGVSQCLEPVDPPHLFYSQAVTNLVAPHIRGLVSKLVKPQPTAQVLPNSGSDSDRLSARAGRKILRHNYYANGYEAEYMDAGYILVVDGMTWIKTQWDPFGGKAYCRYEMEPLMQEVERVAQEDRSTPTEALSSVLNNPPEGVKDGTVPDAEEGAEEPKGTQETGQTGDPGEMAPIRTPVYDEEGHVVMQPKIVDGKPVIVESWYEGKVVKTAVAPFNIYYDPTVRRWSDMFDIIQCESNSVDYVKNNVPNCQDLSPQDADEVGVNPWENIFSMQVDKNVGPPRSGLNVLEYHCKSCEDFPQGLRVVIVKDEIRMAGPMPDLEGERLPYSFGKYLNLPGSLRGMSVIEFLMGPQAVLNKLLSQHIENAKLAETYRILLPQGTRFSDIVTTETGVVVNVTGPGTPTIMQMPTLPSTHMQLIELMKRYMDFIAMQSETSFGFIPPNITSGEMLEGAVENNYQAHIPEMETYAGMIADSCSIELRLMQKNMRGEILTRFLGPDGKLQTEKFKASILRNNFDVICIPGKMGNESRAVQRRNIEALLPIVTQAQGTPEQQRIITQKAIDYIFGGEEEILIDEVNRGQNGIRYVIQQIQESYNDPKYQVHMQPYEDPYTWREAIQNVLINREEFDRWNPISKDRLMNLWIEVTQRLDAMEKTASTIVGGGPAPTARPGPSGPQEEGPPTESNLPGAPSA